MPPPPNSVGSTPPGCSPRAAKAATPAGSLVVAAVDTRDGTTQGNWMASATPAVARTSLRARRAAADPATATMLAIRPPVGVMDAAARARPRPGQPAAPRPRTIATSSQGNAA
jgi:hypothetical protein